MSEPIFFDNEQAWLDARRGLFTASNIHKLCINGKRTLTEAELEERKKSGSKSTAKTIECETVLSDGALTYIEKLIADMESEPEPEFYSADMQWGKDNEPAAAREFCNRMGIDMNAPDFMYAGVSDPIFFMLSSIAGCSPDMLWSDSGGEIKCPKSSTHIKYLQLKDEFEFKDNHFDYWCQIQFNMLCTKRYKWYFISFDPRFKDPKKQMKIILINADVDFQSYMARRLPLAQQKKLEILESINN